MSPLSPLSPDLATVIAECLSVHAEAMDRLGTDRPELDARIPDELRAKLIRQRANVSATLEGDPEVHRQHVEALTLGLRVVLRRLAPTKPKPPAPPMPTWDATGKRWVVPEQLGLSLPEPPAKPKPIKQTELPCDHDCPNGHRFGHECDSHKECSECPAFDPCFQQFMKIHEKESTDA
jgi:hypothetical protein